MTVENGQEGSSSKSKEDRDTEGCVCSDFPASWRLVFWRNTITIGDFLLVGVGERYRAEFSKNSVRILCEPDNFLMTNNS